VIEMTAGGLLRQSGLSTGRPVRGLRVCEPGPGGTGVGVGFSDPEGDLASAADIANGAFKAPMRRQITANNGMILFMICPYKRMISI
jgi:hypothetical protein